MIVKKQDGVGTEEVKVADYIGEEYVKSQCLTDEEIMVLVDYGLKIEELYGAHQGYRMGI